MIRDGINLNTGETYEEYVAKFQNELTTDDTFTPDYIYDTVADWVAEEYGVDRKNFVRPFWPGGNYQAEEYGPDDIVVDNPPFSILKQITLFYQEHGIKYFLFGPGLATRWNLDINATVLATNIQIQFTNKARVNCSFITNLETEYVIRSTPELFRRLEEVQKKEENKTTKTRQKYAYPDNITYAPIFAKCSKWGIDYGLKFEDCVFISQLDSQRETKKTIFGGGYLISTKAAAEKAAAEKAAAEKAAAEKAGAIVWELSEREKEIIKELDRKTE